MNDPDPEILGNFDGVDSDGHLTGWAWSPAEPSVRRTLWLYAGDEQVAGIVADRPRADLAAQGFGDGRHGFTAPVPPHDSKVEFTIRDAVSGVRLLGSVVLGGGAPPRAPLQVVGNLDEITADGWLSGWCWYPADPARRAGLRIYVDDVEVGTAVAAEDRPDLKGAGIGDGRHGFSFALPAVVLLQRGEVWITARDQQTGALFGKPIIKRLGQTAPVDERIAQLERQVRMLRAEVEGYARRALGRDEDRAARELFRTVGAFFQELAEGPVADGFPGAGLRGRLDDFTARFPPLALAEPERVAATVVVVAASAVEIVYGCLRALAAGGADRLAEFVVIDDGSQGGEMAWLPSVVRNLRYRRLAPGTSVAAACNETAAAARGEVVVFLAADLLATGDWLDVVMDTFAAEPEAAMIGCRVLRRDGMVDDSGIALDGSLIPTRPGRAEAAEAPAFRFMRPVDGLANNAVAIRRASVPRAALFDEGYVTASGAMLDLSLAARQAGRTVLHQPAAVFERATEILRDDPHDPNDFIRLQRAWLARGVPATSVRGRILVVADHAPLPAAAPGGTGLFEHMQALRRLGYRVTSVNENGRFEDGPAVADLERGGIEVARGASFSAPFDVLRAAGTEFAFVFVNRRSALTALADRVRSLAPQARIIYDPVGPAFLHAPPEAPSRGGKKRPPKADPSADPRAAELAAIDAADAVVLATEAEVRAFAGTAAAGKLHLLPPALAVAPLVPPFSARRGIAFAGSLRDASGVDAVAWFVADILPLILQVAPDAVLTIVEPDPPDAVRGLLGANVVLAGAASAGPSVLGGVRVSVSPRRLAAGPCREIAASLARGVPVVGTPMALEASGFAAGEGATAAKDAAMFANAVVRLHSLEAGWTDQSRRGLDACRERHDPVRVQAAWAALLGGLR